MFANIALVGVGRKSGRRGQRRPVMETDSTAVLAQGANRGAAEKTTRLRKMVLVQPMGLSNCLHMGVNRSQRRLQVPVQMIQWEGCHC